MTDPARRFHEDWLGMVQPSEELVVSGACSSRRSVSSAKGERFRRSSRRCFGTWSSRRRARRRLRLYVIEGKQELRPTTALDKLGASEKGSRGSSSRSCTSLEAGS